MKELTVNEIKLEVDSLKTKKFLNQIVYPIAIIDFETFRIFKKNSLPPEAKDDLFEKIFSVAVVIFNKPSELSLMSLNNKKLRLFSKTELPKEKNLDNLTTITPYQKLFFNFLIKKLLKYRIKSLVTLDRHTEVNLLRTYLKYFAGEKKLKTKVNYFFEQNKIFDLYDVWNNDQVINLPEYKDKNLTTNKIGATKKTLLLISNNHDYLKVLNPKSVISNNDIGRTIDQYFINRNCLLDNFLRYVADHNLNDVLIGATILSFLYRYC
ncbi:MAG: hypothetical protein REH79_03510 [Spiroplasma sp.]|nr:hypothetical protein [Spiroplasma sp.]